MLDVLVHVGTLLSIAIAAVGLFLGIRVYRRQMSAQLFLAYTNRYEDIIASLPASARNSRFDLEREPPASSEELSLATLRYLNLCSEEFYLHEHGFLDKKIWRIWEAELERTLKSPLLRREWRELRSEFTAYSDFAAFVDRIQAES